MKRIVLALAAGMIAATTFHATESHAGGFGLHLSPVFIPRPVYPRAQRRTWDYEDRYERRERLFRSHRVIEARRRAAAAAKLRKIEIQKERAAEAKRLAAVRAARIRQRAAARLEDNSVATASVPVASLTAAPPVPAKRDVAVAARPVPTEALLTKQEQKTKIERSSAVANSNETEPASTRVKPVEPAQPTPTAELGCKQFLPGPGITISVPCSK